MTFGCSEVWRFAFRLQVRFSRTVVFSVLKRDMKSVTNKGTSVTDGRTSVTDGRTSVTDGRTSVTNGRTVLMKFYDLRCNAGGNDDLGGKRFACPPSFGASGKAKTLNVTFQLPMPRRRLYSINIAGMVAAMTEVRIGC